MNPVFSIITCTYNAESTVERTLKSVAAQTYPHIEHIIIDGASKDKTLDIIRNSQFPILNSQLVSEPDKGLYDAMNKGIARATGDYVWFMNAGDVFHEDTTVEKIVATLKGYFVPRNDDVVNRQSSIVNCQLPDVMYGETDIADDAGKFIAHRRLKAPEKLTWKSFAMGMLVSHQAFIVKRGLALQYDLLYRFSADFDWCIRCMKSAKIIFNTHLIVADYLNEGMTTANRKASLKERFSIMSRYYGYVPTLLRHLWFAVRFYVSKVLGRQL